MTVGERIRDRLDEAGLSQSELARRVNLTQPAINALVRGSTRTSLHLHRIARELGTTPAYLAGETDDPDLDAPPPAAREPRASFVTMQVALPSEDALARMFEALLRAADRKAPVAELARMLAKRLPTGLSRLQDLLPPDPDETTDEAASPEPQPGNRRTKRRAPRT